jgi:tetratricopeptide (TPR) repeat protein
MRKLGEKHHIESVVRAEDSVLKKINARVDGHPKAIEVVIPVLESEPLEKVLEGLPEVLADDIGPILDWSFKLLTPEAKAFLLEISVYDGVVEYEGLSAIHGGGVSVLVKELVEKNLLSYDDVRKLYSLHPLVREFAYNQVEKERRRELHRMAARYFWSEKGKDPVRGIYHSYDAEDWKDGMSATHTILETLIVRGFWTEAKSLCEEGLSVSRKIEDEKEESYFLFSLARMLWRLGELDEAVKLYKQSLEILEKLGDQSGISRSLHQLAMIEQDRGNYDEAVKLYKQSLEILEKLGDQSGISASLHQLANVEYLRGNYDEAVKLYKQSLEIKQKLGDQRGIAISFHALGLLSETRNQLDLAKEYLEKALQIFRKIGDKPNMNKAEKVLQRILSETQEKQ